MRVALAAAALCACGSRPGAQFAKPISATYDGSHVAGGSRRGAEPGEFSVPHTGAVSGKITGTLPESIAIDRDGAVHAGETATATPFAISSPRNE